MLWGEVGLGAHRAPNARHKLEFFPEGEGGQAKPGRVGLPSGEV